MEHPINGLLDVTMQKIREMIDVNTIIGDAITTADGMTIIPVSKLSVGFGSGGSDHGAKGTDGKANFGGGSGAGLDGFPGFSYFSGFSGAFGFRSGAAQSMVPAEIMATVRRSFLFILFSFHGKGGLIIK